MVFKAMLKKNVEPTAWSRAKGIAGMDIRDVTIAHLSRRGLDEFGLRGLSHGRFTSFILTRNVAETVLLSQLQKKLREDNIDVDATIDALYKSKSMTPPCKVKEAATYVAPLVDEFLQSIKPCTAVSLRRDLPGRMTHAGNPQRSTTPSRWPANLPEATTSGRMGTIFASVRC